MSSGDFSSEDQPYSYIRRIFFLI